MRATSADVPSLRKCASLPSAARVLKQPSGGQKLKLLKRSKIKRIICSNFSGSIELTEGTMWFNAI